MIGLLPTAAHTQQGDLHWKWFSSITGNAISLLVTKKEGQLSCFYFTGYWQEVLIASLLMSFQVYISETQVSVGGMPWYQKSDSAVKTSLKCLSLRCCLYLVPVDPCQITKYLHTPSPCCYHPHVVVDLCTVGLATCSMLAQWSTVLSSHTLKFPCSIPKPEPLSFFKTCTLG